MKRVGLTRMLQVFVHMFALFALLSGRGLGFSSGAGWAVGSISVRVFSAQSAVELKVFGLHILLLLLPMLCSSGSAGCDHWLQSIATTGGWLAV